MQAFIGIVCAFFGMTGGQSACLECSRPMYVSHLCIDFPLLLSPATIIIHCTSNPHMAHNNVSPCTNLPCVPLVSCSFQFSIGVNSTAFWRKLTLFLEQSRFPAFHSKCPAFLAYFELAKMHSMRSFQRQVELSRLGNQLPVLGKAKSLLKLVKCSVFCLFVKL